MQTIQHTLSMSILLKTERVSEMMLVWVVSLYRIIPLRVGGEECGGE